MYHIHFQEESLLPRERLVEHGADKLSNQELLAIFIRTGTKQEPVSMVAHKLVDEIKNLSTLRDMSLEELQHLPGIGRVKAIELQAMMELGKRINQSHMLLEEQILSSEKLGKKLMIEIGKEKQEHLVAFYLNTQNQIIRQKTIFIGMATSIIIAHNHPSGSIYPSKNDIRFTEQLKKSCETLGLVLLDHLIVAADSYYSFREEAEII